MVIGSVFVNAGVELDMDKLIESMPSSKTIHTSVTNIAVDAIILNQQSIINNPRVYLLVDKGNKKWNKNLAKFLC